ncbi:hypothetical protein L5F25_11075 [Aliarcobacter butzleri]|uniref:hypothetical protein n=2 Tax=Campylobacterales TaxID=213849 RepID=UPI001EDAB3AC|nr:hypothetical protein [Aliarcobacter butzleri]MCG3709532.1 hypothetical protein [Aliarcobacter butzleri]
MFKITPDDKSKYNGKKRYKITIEKYLLVYNELSDFCQNDNNLVEGLVYAEI